MTAIERSMRETQKVDVSFEEYKAIANLFKVTNPVVLLVRFTSLARAFRTTCSTSMPSRTT